MAKTVAKEKKALPVNRDHLDREDWSEYPLRKKYIYIDRFIETTIYRRNTALFPQ